MNRIMKKLVPGVLAAALALGAVPSGITFDDIKTSAATDYRKVVGQGGSIGTTINAKLVFHVPVNDTEVDSIKIKDPDDGQWVVYPRANNGWTEYEGSGAVAGDYIVTVPVNAKNMTKSIVFKMSDASGNDVDFEAGLGYDESSYSFSVKSYLKSLQNTVSNGMTGIHRDIKDNADDYDKALWDLCNALINYGDWSEAYFYHKKIINEQPEDGRYEPYNYGEGNKPDDTKNGIDPNTGNRYHPNYPSWWDDLASKTEEIQVVVTNPETGAQEITTEQKTVYYHKYWKSIPESETAQSFNTLLSDDDYICNVSYQLHGNSTIVNGANDNGAPYKQCHQYNVSLVLEDQVKLRVRVRGCEATTATVSVDSNLVSTDLVKKYSSDTHQNQHVYNSYIDSEPLSFNELDISPYFTFKTVCPDTTNYKKDDVIQASALGYARIANNKRVLDPEFEQSGLANTVRALVTVSTAAHVYDIYATQS